MPLPEDEQRQLQEIERALYEDDPKFARRIRAGDPWVRSKSSGKHGDSLPLLPGSSRTAAAASQTGPDDLAAELNPHETELNPHKAVPGG